MVYAWDTHEAGRREVCRYIRMCGRKSPFLQAEPIFLSACSLARGSLFWGCLAAVAGLALAPCMTALLAATALLLGYGFGSREAAAAEPG